MNDDAKNNSGVHGNADSLSDAAEIYVSDKKFVQQLERDFTEIKFVHDAERFSYRLKNGVPTVFLGPAQPNFALLTLHELGHALCGHKAYVDDVSRLKIESEAWERAKTAYLKYQKQGAQVPRWDEDFVQEKLDTYRDWLHGKSKCKKCGLTRFQEDGKYYCPKCDAYQ